MTGKEYYLLLLRLLQKQEKYEDEMLKKCVEDMQKQIEKDEKNRERWRLEIEHPEWFKIISPKEYGQNLLKRKKK